MPTKQFGKSVWTLRVPAKIKTLVWKLTHNGVPVKQQLRNRIPTVDDHCPWCLNELESVMHCFVTCSHSKQVWNLLEIPHQSWSRTSSPFWKWWIELVDSLKATQDRQDILALFAFGIWRLWLARNEKVFEGKDCPAQDIYAIALSLAEEYKIHRLPLSLLP